MWPTKWALKAFLASVGILGWVLAVWALRRPIPPPAERVETKVEYVDRVVTKTVEKVVRAPDGTVTEIKEVTGERMNSTTNTQEVVKSFPHPDYSVGVTARMDWKSVQLVYGVELGRYLGAGFWGTVSVDTEKNVTGGISWHF
jgi:hypothetical protein